MEYVSAEWFYFPTGERVIKALDADGNAYWVPEADCDVPPWPEFLEKHGVKAIKEPPQPKAKKGRK
jgi:hypothetical protein